MTHTVKWEIGIGTLTILAFFFIKTPLFPITIQVGAQDAATQPPARSAPPTSSASASVNSAEAAAVSRASLAPTQVPQAHSTTAAQPAWPQVQFGGRACDSGPFALLPSDAQVSTCVGFLFSGDHQTSFQFMVTPEQYRVWGTVARYGVAWWTDYSRRTNIAITFPDGTRCTGKSFQVYPGTFSVTILPGIGGPQPVTQGQITPNPQLEHGGLPYCVPSSPIPSPDKWQ